MGLVDPRGFDRSRSVPGCARVAGGRLRDCGRIGAHWSRVERFPTIFDGPGDRYFVVPVMLVTLAVLVSLNGLLFSSTWWVGGIVVLVVLGLWLPQLPAGAFRSTPAPAWSDEVARVSAACKADPMLLVNPPTRTNVNCLVVWRWLA